jgi:hypothetical protein
MDSYAVIWLIPGAGGNESQVKSRKVVCVGPSCLIAEPMPICRLAKERFNHRHVGKMRIEALDLVAAKGEHGSQMLI